MKTLTSSGYCGAIFIANKVEGRIEMKGADFIGSTQAVPHVGRKKNVNKWISQRCQFAHFGTHQGATTLQSAQKSQSGMYYFVRFKKNTKYSLICSIIQNRQ